MLWENLTSADFKTAMRDTGVCIVPLGVMEKHSDHLPLGTDCFIAHGIATRAADREPAVVYPSFFFGQIFEARAFPGTITLNPRLLLDLFFNVLDEIARNGFKKIILYNGHGGNTHLLGYLAQSCLAERKPYTLYIPTRRLSEEAEQGWIAQYGEDSVSDHAGEFETSLMLGLHPELVHMSRVPAEAGTPQGNMADAPHTYNAIWWYADHPEHYAGDARKASVEKGQRLVEHTVDFLAQYIRMVKADRVVPGLEDAFFTRVDRVGE
ncbi:MAG: creatininase family protein [Anaerolineae bacterium]